MRKAPKAKKPEAGDVVIVIKPIEIGSVNVRIEGTAPLLLNRMTDATFDEMRKRVLKEDIPKSKGEDPETWKERGHRLKDDSWGHRAVGIEKAIKRGIKNVAGLDMNQAAAILKVIPNDSARNLVQIIGDEPQLDEQLNSPKTGSASIIRRPRWNKWAMEFEVRFQSNILSADQVFHLINRAGYEVGIGARRRELSNEDYGTFKIAKTNGK